ncbi:MAG: RNA methyltransferase [Bdellovibrionales bacterium]|nr:RNA methyltransferase [Bdellovibrionales bacterium]
MQITSLENKTFKHLKQLLEPKGIKKHGEHLLFGESVTKEFEKAYSDRIIARLVSEKFNTNESSFKSYTLDNELFKTLDIFGTNSPILWVKSSEVKNWSESSPISDTELFIATGDPSNLGSLLRSAAAFNWEKVILLKECANPFHPKATRASSGLSARMTLFRGPSIHELNNTKDLIALDLEGENLYQSQFKAPIRLLVGEEGPGIPKSLNIKKIHIPMSDKVESLNATVAASIVMSYLNRNN